MDLYGLTAVVATVMGISVVLIPVMGFTARYVLRPFQDSFERFLETRQAGERARILEQRTALLEQQVEALEATVTRLSEEAEFHLRLRSGEASSDRP